MGAQIACLPNFGRPRVLDGLDLLNLVGGMPSDPGTHRFGFRWAARSRQRGREGVRTRNKWKKRGGKTHGCWVVFSLG